ncbi:MAG: carboxymuconolactone decarboxylase family protein [Anaerolineae bacterium]|nr:carboxymuconolactone decarboxylase family protein [Anaerolineae bacterium]
MTMLHEAGPTQAATRRPFSRRTLTTRAFVTMTRDLIRDRADIRAAARGGRVEHAFAEKIMLAVTQVNGCRWCNYGHTQAALAAGVSPEEIQQLMALELGAFPEEEAVALAFAQHYAEHKENPDPAAVQRLVDYYGPEMARDIRTYIRMITLGNLYGNTIDALLARLQGSPSPESTLADELVLVLGPVVLPLGMALALRRLLACPCDRD